MFSKEIFGQRLKEVRKKNRETQDDLALVLDVGKSHVSEMERGIRSVLRENGKITVSEVRDMFETSRRCAKQMLEYTDRTGMTRKEGAESERVGNL